MTAAATPEGKPEPGTYWRARDGRKMKLDHWLPDRANPTAFMVVINPSYRMRKYSEQSLDGFGSFLTRIDAS